MIKLLNKTNKSDLVDDENSDEDLISISKKTFDKSFKHYRIGDQYQVSSIPICRVWNEEILNNWNYTFYVLYQQVPPQTNFYSEKKNISKIYENSLLKIDDFLDTVKSKIMKKYEEELALCFLASLDYNYQKALSQMFANHYDYISMKKQFRAWKISKHEK